MLLRVKSVTSTKRPCDDPVAACARLPRGVRPALLTGKGPDDVSRFSFLAWSPHTVITYRPGAFQVCSGGEPLVWELPFFEGMKRLLAAVNFQEFPFPLNKAGLLGLLSFELYREGEDFTGELPDLYPFPLAEFILYRHYIIWDHAKQKSREYEVTYDGAGLGDEAFCEETAAAAVFTEKKDEKEAYIARINRIIDYIRAGDVYEVNLTRPFSYPFSGDPFALFERLYRTNPAPFSAYIDGGAFQVVSNSPEMFLRAEGRSVETRPIKGTVPTSPDVKRDGANRSFLLSSPKEEAELFMIIDLLRNDLARVSWPGSVKVIHSKRCEKYQNVYHLVGVIQSLLQKNRDYADLFRAAFPGGSITGCPKIRSMEIIRELEQHKRHLYTGSIVMMNSRSLISSIAIRTAVASRGRIFFNAGGAVTVESDPEREYDEVLTKVSNFLEVFR